VGKAMKYTLPVKYLEESDEYYIEFPDGVMEELKWNVGDELEWKDNNDGSFIVSKKEIK
jgi:uncharacterized membrane protein (UPF0127 family)